MSIWIQLVIELFLVLIRIGYLGYLVSSINFSISILKFQHKTEHSVLAIFGSVVIVSMF